ncbi:hypothetical protein EGR_10289 [Echinococcus granulosus]|uniref:Uncharacterized protein n=1 Tax=Echinococcus granulosus TaxID=6210 RepID=W6U2R4_ECHGR|nr:hypothetical protein EGR_10289 [Echinococcus granulosus]EUB54846.1 hypothetical protein EGR_10289 [Echinococcus granulosus]
MQRNFYIKSVHQFQSLSLKTSKEGPDPKADALMCSQLPLIPRKWVIGLGSAYALSTPQSQDVDEKYLDDKPKSGMSGQLVNLHSCSHIYTVSVY